MVQSKAQNVDDYIAEATPERAAAMRMVRELALRELPGYEERMGWGMAVYYRGEESAFAFANQKQYLALYVSSTVSREKYAEALKGADCGKVCIRFRKPSAIDPRLIEALLRDTAAADVLAC